MVISAHQYRAKYQISNNLYLIFNRYFDGKFGMTTINPTVLIVDDSPENLALLGELLDTTYRVRVATSGIQALTAAHTHPHIHKTS